MAGYRRYILPAESWALDSRNFVTTTSQRGMVLLSPSPEHILYRTYFIMPFCFDVSYKYATFVDHGLRASILAIRKSR